MRIRTILVLAVAAACLAWGLWTWRTRTVAAARQLADCQSRQAVEATDALLDKKYQFPMVCIPLEDFAQVIGETSGLAVDIDKGAIESRQPDVTQIDSASPPAGVGAPQLGSIFVHVPGGTLSLRSVLNLALEYDDLAYDVHDGRLVITTTDASRDKNDLLTQVYPLPQPEFASAEVDQEVWEEVLWTTVEPQMWDQVGGPGHCEAVPGALVVAQPAAVHRHIRRCLDAMSRLANPSDSLATVRLAPLADEAAEESLRRRLGEVVSLEYRAAGLDDLLVKLARERDLPIALDFRHIMEAGIDRTLPVTRKFDDVPLDFALQSILSEFELSYCLRDEAIVVTTPEQAESQLVTVAFPIHDLVRTEEGEDYDSLIELLTAAIAPDSWDSVGGPGAVQPIPQGWLICSQTADVLHRVEHLFATLRHAQAHEDHARVLTISPMSEEHERIWSLVERPEIEAPVSYRNTLLRDVAKDFAERLGMPLVLNGTRVKETGIGPNDTVTVQLPAVPVGSQLQLVMDELQLVLDAKYGTLLITSEVDLQTQLFDVRPLIDPDLGVLTQERLRGLVHAVVAPDSWDEKGGPGSATYFRDLLVVSQTRETLDQVARLLHTLEENCLDRSLAGPTGRQTRRTDERPFVVALDRRSGAEQIEAALARPVALELHDVPLEEALRQLAAIHDVPLFVSRIALAEVFFNDETRVSLSGRSQPLAHALERLLLPHGLTCSIGESALHVTAENTAWEAGQVKLYRIDDLAGGQPGEVMKPLKELNRGGWLNQDMWDDNGGPIAMELVPPSWLVVSAPWQTHQRIEDWLTEQRTGQTPQRELEWQKLERGLEMATEAQREPANRSIIEDLRNGDWERFHLRQENQP